VDDARTVLRLVLLVALLGVGTVTLVATRVTLPFIGMLPGDLHLRMPDGTLTLPLTTCAILGLLVALLARVVTRGFDHTS
jgi:hypothetical protein